jgi:hypothetical protein
MFAEFWCGNPLINVNFKRDTWRWILGKRVILLIIKSVITSQTVFYVKNIIFRDVTPCSLLDV